MSLIRAAWYGGANIETGDGEGKRGEGEEFEPEEQIDAQEAAFGDGRRNLLEEHQAGNVDGRARTRAQIDEDEGGEAQAEEEVDGVEKAHGQTMTPRRGNSRRIISSAREASKASA